MGGRLRWSSEEICLGWWGWSEGLGIEVGGIIIEGYGLEEYAIKKGSAGRMLRIV